MVIEYRGMPSRKLSGLTVSWRRLAHDLARQNEPTRLGAGRRPGQPGDGIELATTLRGSIHRGSLGAWLTRRDVGCQERLTTDCAAWPRLPAGTPTSGG